MRISDWSSDVCSSDLSDNIHFSLTTLQLNPLHFNREYARENGHADIVISAMLVFAIVFGLSVEDLSERGGAFLGVDDLSFARPVHVGDTLTARSTVMALRESKSDRNYGIRSEEHTSELQSLMRNSYAVFCLQKKI